MESLLLAVPVLVVVAYYVINSRLNPRYSPGRKEGGIDYGLSRATAILNLEALNKTIEILKERYHIIVFTKISYYDLSIDTLVMLSEEIAIAKQKIAQDSDFKKLCTIFVDTCECYPTLPSEDDALRAIIAKVEIA
jgi:hypothetical protein